MAQQRRPFGPGPGKPGTRLTKTPAYTPVTRYASANPALIPVALASFAVTHPAALVRPLAITSAGDIQRLQNTDILSVQGIRTNGNLNANAWGTTGIRYASNAATYTDISSSGTVAHTAIDALAIATLVGGSPVTYTNASTLYIAGPPTAGSNVTITNPYALYLAAGKSYFAGDVGIGVVPPAVVSGSTQLSVGNATLLSPTSTAATTYLSANAYNSGGVWTQAVAGTNPSQYTMLAGVHRFYVGSVSGNSVSWTANSSILLDAALGRIGIGGIPSAAIHVTSSPGTSIVSSNGVRLRLDNISIVDASTSGTLALAAVDSLAAPTINFLNAVTCTAATTLYIAGAPTMAGSGTITNALGLYVNARSHFADKVGVGTIAPNYLLSLYTGTPATQLHLNAQAVYDDTGLYVTATASNGGFTSWGMNFVSPNWVAKHANAWSTGGSGANYTVTFDTGLTIGNTFTPTARFAVTSSAVTISLPTTVTTSLTTPLLIGGSSTTQTLTYKTTTGVGAVGADHVFQVGNNGALEAARFRNDGSISFPGNCIFGGAKVSTPNAAVQITGFKAGGNDWSWQTVDADGRMRLFNGTGGTELIGIAQGGAIITPILAADSTINASIGTFNIIGNSVVGYPCVGYNIMSGNGIDVLRFANGGDNIGMLQFQAKVFNFYVNSNSPVTGTIITKQLSAQLDASGNFAALAGLSGTKLTAPLIVGGSGTTQTLTYKTTTGVGATGADHVFLVGNNGNVEAARFRNDASVNFPGNCIFGGAKVLTANAAVQITGSKAGGNDWSWQTVDSDGRMRLFDNTSGAELIAIAQNGATNLIKGSVGVTTNSNAAAGVIGELISGALAANAAIALTTATVANVTSISLTAGDWDVGGTVDYTFAATTSYTALQQGISSTSATLGAQDTFSSRVTAANVPTAANDMGLLTPTVRVSLASTTTIYLVTKATFTVSTLAAYGTIRARRVR